MAIKKITQNVNKDKLFNDLPKVRPVRSKWLNRETNYLACNNGQIVPILWGEVLPGQTIPRIDMASISHTTTPIAPIFPSMYTEYRSFFVPMRLCADLLNGYKDRKSPWVKVFGEDNKSTNSTVIVSLADQKLPDLSNYACADFEYYLDNVATKDNILNALDLDIGSETGETPSVLKDFNFLQLAAYELIYQRHYRNENYESATASPLYKQLFNAYNSVASVGLSTSFTFEIANREKDYFTGMKPFTQKSNEPVKVPLVGDADLAWHPYENGTFSVASQPSVLSGTNYLKGVNIPLETTNVGGNALSNNGKYVADLRTASGITIEELRILIKTQELLEKDAIYGSIYAASLNSHFGCCPLDLTLQDPQELHKVTVTSNMQAIFQTSSTSGESSILGTIGANSTTQTDKFTIIPQTTFKEHGLIMICAVHKLQNVYDSVWFKPKMCFKKSRFDFYTPELNDLGYQPVTKECRAISGTAGYNEAFAEYRYKFNKVHGSLASSFPYWAPAIADEYSSVATLYKEDTAILDKALSVTSSTAPQFYDAYGFEEVEDMPMTLHSIPGMDGVI